jgi:glycosyltransferase involved in cell wall biosynthesis
LSRYGPSAGGDRVRVFDWLQRVEIPSDSWSFSASGTSFGLGAVLSSPLRSSKRHLEGIRHVRQTTADDHLMIYKEGSPLSFGGFESAAIKRAGFSLLDLDDAIFNSHTGQHSIRETIQTRKTHLLAQRVDRVIAGNDYIADWASTRNSDVRIVPSCVDPTGYVVKTDYELQAIPKIIWVGSFSTEVHLFELEPVFAELHRRYGAELVVVSSTGSTKVDGFKSPVTRIPWSEDVASQLIADADIGIMPLVDSPFTRGKCGYKLLQYGAAGLPCVGSPVGVNQAILKSFGSFSPTTPDDYLSSISQIFDMAADRRKSIGCRARSVIETEYSYSAWKPRWVSAVTDA